MAKVSTVDIVPGLELAYWRRLAPGDRFTFSRVRRKIDLLSIKRKKGISQRSLLPQVAEAWNVLSESVKTDWSNAGAVMNLNGYRLFVADKCARIINEISGNATPSLLHQSWVGQLHIEAPASELKIAQLHPKFYWISKKVYGKKGMYEPVQINEAFSLPLKISLNYNSNLASAGGGAFAKFYAEVWSLYQGLDIITVLELSLDLVASWKNAEATISSVIGQVVSYDLFFHLYNVTGDLYIDNIKAEHNGQNWVRDTFCKDINEGFTKAFFQIPKHWAGVTVPSGAWYESVYPS